MQRDFILAGPWDAVSGMAEDGDQWLTTGDAARVLHVSAEMVRQYVQQGKLMCVRTPREQRLFREREVNRFAESRAYLALAPTSPPRPRGRRSAQLRLRLFRSAPAGAKGRLRILK